MDSFVLNLALWTIIMWFISLLRSSPLTFLEYFFCVFSSIVTQFLFWHLLVVPKKSEGVKNMYCSTEMTLKAPSNIIQHYNMNYFGSCDSSGSFMSFKFPSDAISSRNLSFLVVVLRSLNLFFFLFRYFTGWVK